MLLATDIGNSNIVFGLFKGDRLVVTWRVATELHRTEDEYATLLLELMRHAGLAASDVSEIILCSVVPPLVATFESLCRRYFKTPPLVVEPGVKTGVRISLDNPREVGADRIVNAAAAHHLYGGPLIVIDLGTATTFDTVSKEGDYLGGAIAPGIGLAAESLFGHTAMLPRVELVRPKSAIGKNTVAAMQSGLIFGYVGLIEGIVARIQKELQQKATVIATGGWATVIAPETKVIQTVNPDLTLIGLQLIYNLNRSQH